MCIIETFIDTIYRDETGRRTVRQSFRTRRGKIRYRFVALESCQHCGAEYVPTRRGVQKYCTDSCRRSAWTKRTSWQEAHPKPTAPTVVEMESVNPVSSPSKDTWSWMRTAENTAASGTVAIAQYHAIENMISKHLKQVGQEVKQSEVRTAQRLKQLTILIKNKVLSLQNNNIDAMNAEEVAKKLLE